MRPLQGKVALVTGASRGVGKGIALALGDAGATVVVTGRSTDTGPLPGTIHETAREVTARGGEGVAIRCDHGDDADVGRAFGEIAARWGGLDLLVNNVFAVPDGQVLGPFWTLPLDQWDTMHRVGLRSHYVATWLAAPEMVRRRAGLVINVSSYGAKISAVNAAYGAGKAALDRLTRDMAKDLAPHGVSVVSIWPGIVKTERLVVDAERLGFDPSKGESAELSGRAVVALATDPAVAARTGKALVVAELAREYGFRDVDGSLPEPLVPPKRG